MRITLEIPVTSSSSHPAEDGLLCCWKPNSSVLSHKLGQDDFLPSHLSHYCWPQNFFLYPDVIHYMKPFFSSRESSLQRGRKLFSVYHPGCLWLQTTFVTRCASVMGELPSGPPELGFMTRRLLSASPNLGFMTGIILCYLGDHMWLELCPESLELPLRIGNCIYATPNSAFVTESSLSTPGVVTCGWKPSFTISWVTIPGCKLSSFTSFKQQPQFAAWVVICDVPFFLWHTNPHSPRDTFCPVTWVSHQLRTFPSPWPVTFVTKSLFLWPTIVFGGRLFIILVTIYD